MQVVASTISFTVVDIQASSRFFTECLGFTEKLATEDMAVLERTDVGAGVVFVRAEAGYRRGPRHPTLDEAVLTLTVRDLAVCEARLRAGGEFVSRPPRVQSWGERLLAVADPNGITVHLVEWPAPAPLGPRSARHPRRALSAPRDRHHAHEAPPADRALATQSKRRKPPKIGQNTEINTWRSGCEQVEYCAEDEPEERQPSHPVERA